MSRLIYQTHLSASSAAIARACKLSPSGRAYFVPRSGGDQRERAVRPFEGGVALAVEDLGVGVGYGIKELTAAELAQRCRVGLRREIDELIERARKSQARAKELLGSKFAARHRESAHRDLKAAELLLEEGDDEPITSSERDNRVAV